MFASEKDKYLPTDLISDFRGFLKSSGFTTATVKNYLTDLRHLLVWVTQNVGQFQFTTITEKNLRAYRSYLKEKFRSKPSISARRLSSLRKFLSWAAGKGFVTQELVKSAEKVLEESKAEAVFPSPIQLVSPSQPPATVPAQPADLSTYKIHQKVIHHIKNTRPGWYHRYHQRDWASTLHTVIMVLFAITVVSLFVYTEIIRPQLEQTRDQFAEELGDVLAAATPPRILSFQGRLTDNDDTPISIATNIVFKIYSVRTGGSALWTSRTWSVTPDQNGIFSVCLGGQDASDDCLLGGGADTAIPSTLFSDNAALYLGVTAGGDSEMTPRQRIASVSYALNSDALEGFHGSQSPGANQVPILDGSGNLAFGGAASITTGSGDLTINSAGAFVSSDNIDFNGSGTNDIAGTLNLSGNNLASSSSLTINSGGSVDIQDAVTVDSLTTDVGGITILAGQSIIPSGAGTLTIGNGSLQSLTVTTDSTGNAEVILPDGSISGTEITDDTIVEADLNAQGTLTDEWCLTYEGGGGALFQWQACGGGSQTPWTSDIDADGYDLTDLSNIQFRETTSAPAGTEVALYRDNAGDLNLNALTGKTINLQVNGSDEYTFSSSVFNLNTNGISGAGLTDCDGSGSKLLWNSGTNNFSCGSDRATYTNVTSSNYTNATTSFTDVPGISFTIGPDETWVFEMWLQSISPTAADSKLQVTITDATSCDLVFTQIESGAQVISNIGCNTTSGTLATDGTDESHIVNGVIVNDTDTDTAQLQFGQAAGPSGTSTIYAGSYIKAYKISGADLAEVYYSKEPALAPGTVVSFDPSINTGVKKSSRSYDPSLAGVVSTKPAQVLGDNSQVSGSPVFLALTGRVPVKVSTENGPIAPGDLLTSSSTPGVGMRATRAGYVIGRALTAFSGDGIGSVLTFVNTHYVDPARLDKNGSLSSTFDWSLGNKEKAAALEKLRVDKYNNLFTSISEGSKFIWENSLGETFAWISDTGAAFFQKVTALVGDFGKLVFGELAVKADSQAAGEAKIKEGETEIFVESEKVTEDSLIYITSTTKTDGLTFYLKEQKPSEGFMVALERSAGDKPREATASANKALKFNWLIINRE